MSDIITVTNLSKMYTIHHEKTRYKSLRDDITNFFKRPYGTDTLEKFYALKDITFSVKEGETLGIIGSNGAGKSTLLKILSRITIPTKGEIKINGRISSLLEVGTGFHPELTGRENIYLNGSILGMKRQEVRRKFDEIVDFAEIEKFLDTPVKHYSSGMYTRLAFAVAAHLEPEILIVDEVLAVGDVKFQKKCLGKMSEVGKQGRTVIFVSHNMAAIGDLCKNSIFLDKGTIVKIGPTAQVIATYLSKDNIESQGKVDLIKTPARKNSLRHSAFSFSKLTLLGSAGKSTSIIKTEESFSIQLDAILQKEVPDLLVAVTILSNGIYPIYTSQILAKEMKLSKKDTTVVLTLTIDPNIFSPGIYTISLGASGNQTVEWIPEALTFTIQATEEEKKIQSIYDALVIYPKKWTVKV